MKKFISILICIIMALSAIPFASSADGGQSLHELYFTASDGISVKVRVRVVNRDGMPLNATCSQTSFDVYMDDDADLNLIFSEFDSGNAYACVGAFYGSIDGPQIRFISQQFRKGVQNVFFLTALQKVRGRYATKYNGDYFDAVDVVSATTLVTCENDIYVVYDDEERTYPVSHPREGRADVTLLCDLSQGMDAEVSPGVTRRDVVLDKVSDFAEDLLALNGDSGNGVRVRLVGFGNAIDSNFDSFTKFSGEGGFASYLEDVRDSDFGVGRNWESALCNAWTYYWMGYDGDVADRYVILISEGSPTCRMSKGNYSYFGAMENNGVSTSDPLTLENYYSLGYSMAGEYQYTLGTYRNYFPALNCAKRLTRYPREDGGGVDLRTICVFDGDVDMLSSLKYLSGHDTYSGSVPYSVDGYTFAAGGDALETALDDLYNEIATYVPLPEPPAPTVIPGDANGDGDVDIKDVYTLKKIVAGAAMITPGSDVDLDGSVDSKDVKALKAIVAGAA